MKPRVSLVQAFADLGDDQRIVGHAVVVGEVIAGFHWLDHLRLFGKPEGTALLRRASAPSWPRRDILSRRFCPRFRRP